MARSAAQQGLGAKWQPCASHTRATPALHGVIQQVEMEIAASFQEMGEITLT